MLSYIPFSFGPLTYVSTFSKLQHKISIHFQKTSRDDSRFIRNGLLCHRYLRLGTLRCHSPRSSIRRRCTYPKTSTPPQSVFPENTFAPPLLPRSAPRICHYVPRQRKALRTLPSTLKSGIRLRHVTLTVVAAFAVVAACRHVAPTCSGRAVWARCSTKACVERYFTSPAERADYAAIIFGTRIHDHPANPSFSLITPSTASCSAPGTAGTTTSRSSRAERFTSATSPSTTLRAAPSTCTTAQWLGSRGCVVANDR